MTRNQIVFLACTHVAAFWIGGLVFSPTAPKIQPCPQGGKASLIKATVTGQQCTYAEIVGRRFKWSVRAVNG